MTVDVDALLSALGEIHEGKRSGLAALASLWQLDAAGVLEATRPPNANELTEARAQRGFEVLANVSRALAGLGAEHPASQIVSEHSGHVRDLGRALLQALQASEPPPGNPNERNRQLQTVNQQVLNVTRALGPAIAATVVEGELGRSAAEARKAADSAKAAQTVAEEAAEATQKQFDDIRHQATESAALARSIDFKNLAGDHAKASMRWLGVATLLAAFLACLAVYFLFCWAPKTAQLAWVHLPSEVLLFSIGAFALAVATKTFRVHKHLEEVYKQRVATVDTFLSFLNAAEDEETRRAVFLEIAKALYQPQPPGYLSSGGPEAPGPIAVAMLREVGAMKSSPH